MRILSRLKELVRRNEPAQPASDPLSGVCWVAPRDNPFGVELLDCRSVAQSMLTVTQDPAIAESFVRLRGSSGEQYRGRAPEDSETFDCDLRYPHKEDHRDGPIFKAETMEDKWDIYLYDGQMYFARSWTGDLEYRAKIVFRDDEAIVISVTARRALDEGDPAFPVAVVDYLIRSHLFRLPAPHPLPKKYMGQDPRQLAYLSFLLYGRHGLYGAFSDTTRLRLHAQEQSDQPDV